MATADNVQFYQRLLGVAGLAIVAVLVYQIIEPFLGPIAWALFLGFLLQSCAGTAQQMAARTRLDLGIHADDAGAAAVPRPADRARDRVREAGGGTRGPAADLAGHAAGRDTQ